MKIPCNTILDLIPLVKDAVASEESTQIVYKHIENCSNCREEFDSFASMPSEQPSFKDERIIYAIKRSIFLSQFIVLIAGATIGIILTNSMNMFYNFLIMPIIGGVSVLMFKRKWYFAPIGIFIFGSVFQLIKGIVLGIDPGEELYMGAVFSFYYAGLVVLGAIIAWLLKFAFKKEGTKP